MLSKDQLLAAMASRRTHSFDVPELGGTVCVRKLSENETAATSKATADFTDATRVRSTFAAMALCDESGTRLFTDTDAATLADWEFTVLDKIWREGGKFNGLIVDDKEPAKN